MPLSSQSLSTWVHAPTRGGCEGNASRTPNPSPHGNSTLHCVTVHAPRLQVLPRSQSKSALASLPGPWVSCLSLQLYLMAPTQGWTPGRAGVPCSPLPRGRAVHSPLKSACPASRAQKQALLGLWLEFYGTRAVREELTSSAISRLLTHEGGCLYLFGAP